MPCWDTVCCWIHTFTAGILSHCHTLVSVHWFCLAWVWSVFCVNLFSFHPVSACVRRICLRLNLSLATVLYSVLQAERGVVWHRAAHRRSLPAGPSEGQAGACCSVPLLPLLFGSPGVRLLYAPPDATFVPARRSPLRAGLNQGVRM